MNIHWFTPFGPERTDIARFSRTVCDVLAQHCKLSLWTHPRSVGQARRTLRAAGVEVFPYTAARDQRIRLNRADALFYNIGNNAAFHREMIATMREFPGVAILHDLSLFECIGSIYRERLGGDRLFCELADFEYGAEKAEALRDWLNASDLERKERDIAGLFPFVRHGSLGAWGLVTHTQIPENSELYPDARPRWQLQLPYPCAAEEPPKRKAGEGLRLLMFGYIGGRNRRLEEILNAIAQSPDREDIELHIAGDINPGLEIPRLLKALNISERVKIHGYVSDDKLTRLLEETDLVLNLRFPTRGEASGSLLRAWSCSASVVVTDMGYYAELPDTVVWKIPHASETQALQNLWAHVRDNPEENHAKGHAGFRRLKAMHTLETYAEKLLEIARTPDTERAAGTRALLEQRFGLALADTLQLPPQEAQTYATRLQKELQSWF